MSIVALKRNSARRFNPISHAKGNLGFSLNGGYRNQGRVGQILFGRSLGGTKFKGNIPVGTGGCCGHYNINISNSSSGYGCTNDPTIPKKSSMNTHGRIQSGLIHPVAGEYRNVECKQKCKPIWVKDMSPLNESQGEHIRKVSAKAASKVVRKSDAGLESCKTNCTSSSYFIGTKKYVRTPYAKDLNAFPISQSQYISSILFNKHNLPTPPCKQHFPPKLNTNACGVTAKTPEEAIALGILPADWNVCAENECIHPGFAHKQPAESQNILINTPLCEYTNGQLIILKGQHISK